MNRIARASFWIAVFGLIFLVSVGSISAQKSKGGLQGGVLWEDTAMNPHDFTNDYYEMVGIVGKTIVNRPTGSDGLSVFSNSSNPYHTNIRVIATIPAYDHNGDILFWYPLGEIPDYGFTTDKIGWEARELAKQFPIYIFPHSKLDDFRLFANTRQAALMDNSWSMIIGPDIDLPMFRQVVFVRFTEKAFTEEGVEMMMYMAKKNGTGADDTPILRNMEDLLMMMKWDLVTTESAKGFSTYALAPIITDPTNGVIANDAFLWYATKNGPPLPTEEMFMTQFGCLQKTGDWCGK